MPLSEEQFNSLAPDLQDALSSGGRLSEKQFNTLAPDMQDALISAPAKKQQEPSEPNVSTPEAALRGFSSGALTQAVNIPQAAIQAGMNSLNSPGASLSDLYSEALTKQKEREQLAAKQHPAAYYGAMLPGAYVSPVGSALKGVGLIGEAAEGAPLLQRIFQATKTGAAIGGAYGAGKAATDIDTNKDLGENVQNAAGTIGTEAAGGAVLGGGLHSLGEGISGAVGSLADKEVPLLSNAARRFQLGREGVNLYNEAQLAERTADKFKALGQDGIAAEIDKVTDGMNDVISAAKQKGQTVNYQDVLARAEELRGKAAAMEPGEIQDELLDLAGRVKDSVNQFKTKIPVTTLTKTGEQEIPGEPRVEAEPSSLESLQSQAAKMNQEAQLNSKATNQLAPKYEVKSQVQDGKEYQRIYEITPATAESGESIKPVGKSWTEATEGKEFQPGSPSEIKNTYEPKTEQVLSPELEPQQAKEARTAFGKDRSFDTANAKESAKELYDAMSESLYKGIPEYEPLSNKYSLWKSAMQDLGVDVQTPSNLYTKTPEQMLSAESGRGTTFDPNMAAQLRASFRKAASDPLAAEQLNAGFEKLRAAGFQGIDGLKANAEQALRDENLSYGLVNPKSLLSPIGGLWYKGVKAASVAPNALGLASGALEKGLGQPVTQALGKGLARTPVAGAIGNTIGQGAKDFLGNDIENKPGNFYKNIVAADDNTLQQVGQKLQGTPYEYQGSALIKAIQAGDQQKKNSMIFNIANNPDIEKVIRAGVK